MQSEQTQKDIYRTRSLLALLALFLILFLTTPFGLGLRLDSLEIESVFYWIQLDRSIGIRIDAPFPSGMHAIPNPFWWMCWLEVVFSLAIIGYYRGLISHKTIYRIGLASLGPGLLTVAVGLLLSVYPNLAVGVPVPIPAVLGLYLVVFRPLDEGKMWVEGPHE
jgi:hypothetical protein